MGRGAKIVETVAAVVFAVVMLVFLTVTMAYGVVRSTWAKKDDNPSGH